MADITFSIVTYNSERHIRKAIDGLVSGMTQRTDAVMLDGNPAPAPASAAASPTDSAYSAHSYEILVIDNASTDGTAQAVQEASKAYPGRVRWLPQSDNRGFGAGHNQSLPHMTGRYHAVVNPDIVVSQGMLLDMIRWMDAHPDVGLLSPKILFPDGRLQYLCKHHPTFTDLFIRLVLRKAFRKRQDHFEMRETGYDHEFDVEYATGCFMFFRADVYRQIGGFDEAFFLYLEDADISRRVNEVSRTVFVPSVQVVHEWQRDQHKKLSLMWVNAQSWMHYHRKWRKRQG